MTDQQSSGSYFQPLRIVHASILGVALLFLAIVRFVLLDSAAIETASVEDHFTLYTPVVVMLIGVVVSEWLFRMRLKNAREAPQLTEKLNEYRGASIIRWALLEAPTLFAIVWFMLYTDRYFMAIALVGMALIAFSRPTPGKTAQHLHLNDTERDVISEPGF